MLCRQQDNLLFVHCLQSKRKITIKNEPVTVVQAGAKSPWKMMLQSNVASMNRNRNIVDCE